MKKIIFTIIFILLSTSAYCAELQWGQNIEASEYHIYYRQLGGEQWNSFPNGVTSNLSFEILEGATLEKGVAYEFSIRAMNECGVLSEHSNIVTYNACGVVDAINSLKLIIKLELN